MSSDGLVFVGGEEVEEVVVDVFPDFCFGEFLPSSLLLIFQFFFQFLIVLLKKIMIKH